LKRMRKEGKSQIDAKRDAEQAWKKHFLEVHAKSLRDKVDGWFTGANVPGKTREPLSYAGGIPLYIKTLKEVSENRLEGFSVE